jgi:hypothetical protein
MERFEQGLFGSEMIEEATLADLGFICGGLQRQMRRAPLGNDFFSGLED